MENQLLCLSYINAHFILLGSVTNMSKLLSVCSGTSKLVSSAYFIKMLELTMH